MDFKIHAGMRVLYKHKNQWQVGELQKGNAVLTDNGLFFFIVPKEFIGAKEVPYTVDAEFNEIFWDAFPIEDYIKDYKEYFMTKEEYIQFIESEDFSRATENAYVSDGEYGYYPISQYKRNWIEKQPFDYVIRGE